MQEYMMCSDGKKRKAVRVVCENCGKEQLQRKTSRSIGRFCSGSCAGAFKKKEQRVQVVCSFCHTGFSRPLAKLKNSRSGHYFCNRNCKEQAQKLGGIKDIQPSHYGTRTRPKPSPRKRNKNKAPYRNIFSNEELVCRRCGYKEFVSSVDIHHIDFNYLNNDKSNLLPLCTNCHRALHYQKWQLKDIGLV